MVFSIPEELLLIGLNGKTGALRSRASLSIPLAGAQFMELTLAGRLDLDGKKVKVLPGDPTGDDLLDAALATIENSKKARSAQDWMSKLKTKPQPYLDRLVEKGAVGSMRHKVLGVIPVRRYPRQDNAAGLDAVNRLRALLLEGATPDERTVALAMTVKAAEFDKIVLPDRMERKRAKGQLDQLMKDEVLGKAMTRANQAVQAAIVAASVATSVAATAGSGGS